MNIKEALQTAIKYETKIRDAFRKALEKSSDERTTTLLTLLAHQEHEHVEYLRVAYIKLSTAGKLDRFDAHIEQQLEEGDRSVQRFATEVQNAVVEHRIVKILNNLAAAEKETAAFYRGLCESLPPKEARYFDRFVQIEEKHLAMIEDRLQQYFIKER
jgi:rubrerythrin